MNRIGSSGEKRNSFVQVSGGEEESGGLSALKALLFLTVSVTGSIGSHEFIFVVHRDDTSDRSDVRDT